eukprot:g14966.t1
MAQTTHARSWRTATDLCSGRDDGLCGIMCGAVPWVAGAAACRYPPSGCLQGVAKPECPEVVQLQIEYREDHVLAYPEATVCL